MQTNAFEVKTLAVPAVKSVMVAICARFVPRGPLCWFGVTELVNKPHIGKQAGDFSFPWETQEKGETDERTFYRAIEEEVDRSSHIVQYLTPPQFVATIPVHDSQAMRDTEARLYLATYHGPHCRYYGNHLGIDIQPIHWVSEAKLLSRPRLGIATAFEKLHALGSAIYTPKNMRLRQPA